MSHELLNTSAPKGIKPGSSGFCTVMHTDGLSPLLIERLEGLSSYRHVFSPGDPRAARNPVVWSHVRVSDRGRTIDILSRVSDYGLDYSKRTNRLAHHLVLEPTERSAGGPAWLLAQPGVMQTGWDQQVLLKRTGRPVLDGNAPTTPARLWGEVVGDPGWAGVLAEAGLSDPGRVAVLVFQPGQDLLPLFQEAIALIPVSRRWEITFSTYYTGLGHEVRCAWRGVLKGSPEEAAGRKHPNALVIDLTQKLGPPPAGRLVEAARTGVLPADLAGEAPPSLPPALAPKSGRSGPSSREEIAARLMDDDDLPARPPGTSSWTANERYTPHTQPRVELPPDLPPDRPPELPPPLAAQLRPQEEPSWLVSASKELIALIVLVFLVLIGVSYNIWKSWKPADGGSVAHRGSTNPQQADGTASHGGTPAPTHQGNSGQHSQAPETSTQANVPAEAGEQQFALQGGPLLELGENDAGTIDLRELLASLQSRYRNYGIKKIAEPRIGPSNGGNGGAEPQWLSVELQGDTISVVSDRIPTHAASPESVKAHILCRVDYQREGEPPRRGTVSLPVVVHSTWRLLSLDLDSLANREVPLSADSFSAARIVDWDDKRIRDFHWDPQRKGWNVNFRYPVRLEADSRVSVRLRVGDRDCEAVLLLTGDAAPSSPPPRLLARLAELKVEQSPRPPEPSDDARPSRSPAISRSILDRHVEIVYPEGDPFQRQLENASGRDLILGRWTGDAGKVELALFQPQDTIECERRDDRSAAVRIPGLGFEGLLSVAGGESLSLALGNWNPSSSIPTLPECLIRVTGHADRLVVLTQPLNERGWREVQLQPGDDLPAYELDQRMLERITEIDHWDLRLRDPLADPGKPAEWLPLTRRQEGRGLYQLASGTAPEHKLLERLRFSTVYDGSKVTVKLIELDDDLTAMNSGLMKRLRDQLAQLGDQPQPDEPKERTEDRKAVKRQIDFLNRLLGVNPASRQPERSERLAFRLGIIGSSTLQGPDTPGDNAKPVRLRVARVVIGYELDALKQDHPDWLVSPVND